MQETLDPLWWVTAVELPVLGGLLLMILRTRRDGEVALEALRQRLDAAQAQVREALSAYKLEVAKCYVGVDTLRALEQRLTDHLLRIEAKVELNRLTQGEGCD